MMRFAVPIRFVEIEKSGVHLAVSGFVNGNLANILIDTGASQTVFDKNRIHLFTDQTDFRKNEQKSKGLGTDGMESFDLVIGQFILGELVVAEMGVTLLDLQHVNTSYEQLGLAAIDMVLGGDLLSKYAAEVSYRTSELWLTI